MENTLWQDLFPNLKSVTQLNKDGEWEGGKRRRRTTAEIQNFACPLCPPPAGLFGRFSMAKLSWRPEPETDNLRIKIASCSHAFHVGCLPEKFECPQCHDAKLVEGEWTRNPTNQIDDKVMIEMSLKEKEENEKVHRYQCPLCKLYKDPSHCATKNYLLETVCCTTIYHHACLTAYFCDERQYCMKCRQNIVPYSWTRIQPKDGTITTNDPGSGPTFNRKGRDTIFVSEAPAALDESNCLVCQKLYRVDTDVMAMSKYRQGLINGRWKGLDILVETRECQHIYHLECHDVLFQTDSTESARCLQCKGIVRRNNWKIFKVIQVNDEDLLIDDGRQDSTGTTAQRTSMAFEKVIQTHLETQGGHMTESGRIKEEKIRKIENDAEEEKVRGVESGAPDEKVSIVENGNEEEKAGEIENDDEEEKAGEVEDEEEKAGEIENGDEEEKVRGVERGAPDENVSIVENGDEEEKAGEIENSDEEEKVRRVERGAPEEKVRKIKNDAEVKVKGTENGAEEEKVRKYEHGVEGKVGKITIRAADDG